jgi:nucleoside-diphosphate-sugar epimerase
LTRIGVLGANGQVGAEVCLLLQAQAGIDVVPISRNPTGSAYLRSRGVRCRHGRAADAGDAHGLMSDCDVILNFARPTPGRPVDTRVANKALVANMARCSAPGARLVYFSSLCAYREFRPMTERATVTSYGWEKRGIEKLVRREASRRGQDAWNLRLGHVAGQLQAISTELRRLIRRGPVVVPWAGDYPSNVVYTATIVDAILAIAAGRDAPGTYDLVCSPSWTWRQVLEYEAICSGTELRIEEPVPPLSHAGPAGRLTVDWMKPARALASRLLSSPRTRELGLIALNFLSAETNLRVQSAHFRRRAHAEIDRLVERRPSAEAFLFAQAGSRYLRSLRPTAELLSDPVFRLPQERATGTFAPDLPSATSGDMLRRRLP